MQHIFTIYFENLPVGARNRVFATILRYNRQILKKPGFFSCNA